MLSKIGVKQVIGSLPFAGWSPLALKAWAFVPVGPTGQDFLIKSDLSDVIKRHDRGLISGYRPVCPPSLISVTPESNKWSNSLSCQVQVAE